MYTRMHLCVHVCMRVYVCVCVRACMCVCVYMCVRASVKLLLLHLSHNLLSEKEKERGGHLLTSTHTKLLNLLKQSVVQTMLVQYTNYCQLYITHTANTH